MQSKAENKSEAETVDFLIDNKHPQHVSEGVYILSGQGNSVLIETELGLIISDSGPGGKVTRRMIAELRAISSKPLLAIVYSHGHAGYNFGVQLWLNDCAERGHHKPELIAQERLPFRYKRYQETWGLQSHLNRIQFNVNWPEEPKSDWFTYPSRTFVSSYEIEGGDRKVVVLAAPSETDDAIAIWVPDCKALYAGPAFIRSIPNIGTPLRTFRDPVRWADTLDMMIQLQAEILIPEFGKPVFGASEAEEALKVSVRALRYLRQETVERMNRGMTELEILHDIEYPDEIFAHPLLAPIYGMPEYIVRDIWRSENGWWDRNPTNLHPANPGAVARAIREAISDPDYVLKVAQDKIASGEMQLALHVLDLLALDASGDGIVKKARHLKAMAIEGLASASSSFVSRQIYKAEAKRVRESTGADSA